MPPPIAYFLTWTTYGTRLHHDERGSVSRWHNERGEPYLAPDPVLVEREEASLTHEPIYLTPTARDVVKAGIQDHCAFRSWTIRALNVRTNHVHIVVDCRTGTAARFPEPERVMQELKSWGTRRLRTAELVRADGPIWTYHGSTRWINDDVGFYEAIDYVKNQQ